MFIVIFVFIGVFAILITTMPGDFLEKQPDYVSPRTQNKAVEEFFSTNNITAYKNSWSFIITYPDGYAYNQSGLADGHRVEVFWKNPFTIGPYNVLEFRHAYPSPLGSWWLWSNNMRVQEPYLTVMGEPYDPDLMYSPSRIGEYIDKTQMLRLSSNGNSSYFVVSDGQVNQNFVVANPGSYANLSDAWDAGELQILSSYEIDFEAMKPSAWTLLAELLTFQAPRLGIPGDAGAILSYILGAGIWAAIILLIFAAVTSVIPTISGWRGN